MAASPQATKLLRELTAQVRITAESPEAESVHDLRVAIRRFQQALAISNASSKQIHRGLKNMMGFAGGVRDCDITINLAGKVDAPQRLLRRLHRRRGSGERILLLELAKWMELDTAAKWRQELASSDGSRDPNVLKKAVKRVFKRGDAAEESDKELHPLRIAAKKLRYTLDLIGPSDGARLDQVRELQRRLGDINDYETARRIAAEESAGKSILKRLANRQAKKIRSFHRYWGKEFSGKKRDWKNVTIQVQAAPSRSRTRERQGAA